MLAAKCPNCGATSPISLELPDLLDCSYCAYQGPLPPHIEQEVVAAREALWAMQAQRRQLSVRRFQAVAGVERARWLAQLSFGFVTAVLLCCGGGGAVAYLLTVRRLTLAQAPILGFAIVPLVFSVSVSALLFWWLKRRERRVRQIIAALPPAAPGHPARCHVCGGPVKAEARKPISRCGYCHADNLMAADVMREAAGQQVAVFSAMAQAVRQESEVEDWNSAAVPLLIAAGGYVSPVAGVVVAVALYIGLLATPRDPDPHETYAAVDVSGTRCYGRAVPLLDGRVSVELGKTFPEFDGPLILRSAAVHRVTSQSLVGREIMLDLGRSGRVTGLSATYADDNNQLRVGDRVVDPIGACDAEPQLEVRYSDPGLGECRALLADQGAVWWVDQFKLWHLQAGADLVQVIPHQTNALQKVQFVRTGDHALWLYSLDGDNALWRLQLDVDGAKPLQLGEGVRDFHAVNQRVVYSTYGGIFYRESLSAEAKTLAGEEASTSNIALGVDEAYWLDANHVTHAVDFTGGTSREIRGAVYDTRFVPLPDASLL
ncbi:MAG: hypothetical protein AB7S68_30585 [Polyangiaceae bacterium]